jgi:branched-chain amino acid transport system permease protein
MIESAVAGLISGGAYALLGVCVVLLYRMVGVLNLAQAAIGVFGTYVMLVCFGEHWNMWLCVLIGIVSSAVIGALLGLIMSTWFAEAPLQTRSSVTIAFLIALLTLGLRFFGTDPRPAPDLFGSSSISLLGVVIPMSALVIIVLAVLLAWGIGRFLQATKVGTWLRALAERPTAAELLGIPAQQLTIGVWAVAGAIASLAVMMILPTRSPEFTVLSLLILPAMASALVGVFKSFPITIAGGLGIGLIEGIASSISTIAPYRQMIWFVVMLGALLWTQRKEVWDAAR